MQKQTTKKIFYYLALFSIIILTVLFYFQKDDVIKPPVTQVLPSEQVEQAIALPTKLIIPKIDVETEIEQVGITDTGNMGVPDDLKSVGWYSLGAIPGAKGNAVISGHFDDFFGRPLVFGRLHELVVGDDIYINTEDGKELRFRVTKKELYDYNSFETEDIFGPTDETHLNLITCNGTWFKDIGGYDKRLVIFSEAY